MDHWHGRISFRAKHLEEQSGAWQCLFAPLSPLHNRKEDHMQVLIVEPGKVPYPKEIGEELEDLQQEVSGYIETVYPFPEGDAVLICNEEGKLDGLPLNRSLRDEKGTILDIIAGTFLITGTTEDSFCSLTDSQITKFTEQFHSPERFLISGSKIISIPEEISIVDEMIAGSVFTEEKHGLRLIVRKDDDPISPRDLGDNFGTLICFDKVHYGDIRNTYPDKKDFFLAMLTEHFGSTEKAENYLRESTDAVKKTIADDRIIKELQTDHVILPVYLDRKENNQVSTSPFSDKEGSGQIGWIYASKADVTARFGDWNSFTISLAKERMEGEVSVWNDYIRGENYTYDLIDANTGKVLDGGCWTGDLDSLKSFVWQDAEHLFRDKARTSKEI